MEDGTRIALLRNDVRGLSRQPLLPGDSFRPLTALVIATASGEQAATISVDAGTFVVFPSGSVAPDFSRAQTLVDARAGKIIVVDGGTGTVKFLREDGMIRSSMVPDFPTRPHVDGSLYRAISQSIAFATGDSLRARRRQIMMKLPVASVRPKVSVALLDTDGYAWLQGPSEIDNRDRVKRMDVDGRVTLNWLLPANASLLAVSREKVVLEVQTDGRQVVDVYLVQNPKRLKAKLGP